MIVVFVVAVVVVVVINLLSFGHLVVAHLFALLYLPFQCHFLLSFPPLSLLFSLSSVSHEGAIVCVCVRIKPQPQLAILPMDTRVEYPHLLTCRSRCCFLLFDFYFWLFVGRDGHTKHFLVGNYALDI